jgi:xanthine dehydrogenase accessory factor
MSEFFQTLLESISTGGSPVYATVVATRGSTPQKAGAKAVFLPDGRVLGTIGGGCLEAETQRRALESLRDGQPRLVELYLNDDFGWDDGLICGGTAHVFVDPNISHAKQVVRALLEREAQRQPVALVTVVASPDPALRGSYHLVTESEVVSSIPACSEWQQSLRPTAAKAVEMGEALWEPLPSDAETRVYVEPILPRPVLLIAGAGHIGAAVCKLAAWLGFEVAVVDDRASFANSERLPDAATLIVEDPSKAVRDFPITPDTYVVIVTRGHRHDAKVLKECVHSDAAYIGMIGSRRKVTLIFSELVAEGCCTEERLRDIHSPVGLDIGAQSVEEIAVSIAAELVQARRKRRPPTATGRVLHEL